MVEYKYKFVFKVLNDKLRQEEKDLVIWKKLLETGDSLSKRQANGNIPSAEIRIKELIDVIESIKIVKA